MAIPDYQTIMLPLLKIVAKHKIINLKDVRSAIEKEFKLTEEDKLALLPSGKQTVIYNRVGWASTYLRKAGLMTLPQRGVLEITDIGKKVLLEKPTTINVKFLEKFPDFIKFRSLTELQQNEKSISNDLNVERATPEELLEEAHSQLKSQMLEEILNRLKSCSPTFFEILVIDTIVKLGYGGSRKDAGKAIGKSGDEGIDGIINEDRLGLDVIP